MNEQEKKAFYIANCKCCLLAEAMKTCQNCRFSIGLAEKAILLTDFISLPSQTQAEIFVMSEEC